jgi:glutaredoxin-related protein
MARNVLSEDRIHPTAREKVAAYKAEVLKEVQAAIGVNPIVVIGMRQNPFPKKARKLLERAGLTYKYLEYGSYLSGWHTRLAIKMWTGWPTFPQIFVKGVLVGGASDLERVLASGELAKK